MRGLQSLLAKREATSGFDHLNHRVRCYAHIINICCSHIIAAVTPRSKSHLPPSDNSSPAHDKPEFNDSDDSDDESDDGNNGPQANDDSDSQDNDDSDSQDSDDNDPQGPVNESAFSKAWRAGLKRDPLRRARRLVRFLRSSDQRRLEFQQVILDGNKNKWFKKKNKDGVHVVIPVPDLQLLRDVKTRWDSVYLMLKRLQELRLVSFLTHWKLLETN
jgi:hypothetical protein